MVAARTTATATTGPTASIPDSDMFTAPEYWTDGLQQCCPPSALVQRRSQ